MPAGDIKTFSCPNCGGSIEIRAVGISISAVCGSCGSIIDVANENVHLISKAAIKTRKIAIPLGSRGVIFGVEWEVIGYCAKTDGSGMYDWREYLLFNPYQGFRFLVEADGHWNFVKMLRQSISVFHDADAVNFEDNQYKVFVRGEAVVTYVMGEFYWRVKVGEKTQVADYIYPPYMLSVERSSAKHSVLLNTSQNEDIIWSKAIYVETAEIQQAFNLPEMPYQTGIAPNQPSPYEEKNKTAMKLAGIFFIILFLVQIIAVMLSLDKTLYQQQIHAPASVKGQAVVAESIDIPKTIGNVEVYASSPVSNNWIELNVDLVNDATQESYEITQPVEYYFGSDSDGSWSEGSQSGSTIIPAVAGGKYHLLVTPDAGVYQNSQPIDFVIRIKRDVPVWGNFIVALLIIIIYPLLIYFRKSSFEAKRWATSDYAPKSSWSSGDSNEGSDIGSSFDD